MRFYVSKIDSQVEQYDVLESGDSEFKSYATFYTELDAAAYCYALNSGKIGNACYEQHQLRKKEQNE